MKKLLTLLIVLFAGTSVSFAQNRGVRAPERESSTILRISLRDGSPFSLEIDGRDYERSGSQLTIGDLPPGRHTIRLFQTYTENGRRRNQTRTRTVYQATLRLGVSTFNRVTVDAANGSADIQSNRMDEDGPRTDPRGGGDRGPAYNDNRDGRGAPQAASDFSASDMEALRAQVADRITDGDKLKTIQSATSSRRLSADQVLQMMEWLGFDSTRLDLAKWMYGRVGDTKNYWKLESGFSFDSTKEEFNKFIRSK